MKTQYKALLVALIAGICFWVLDAFVDFIFGEQIFLNLLILDVSPHHLFTRLLAVFVAVVLALVLGSYVAKRQPTEQALRESENKYRFLFANMLEGFAYCKILLDRNNRPVDFVYLEVNEAFERLTGLRKEDVIGQRVTQVIPGIKESHPELFRIYGNVALTGKEDKFEIYFEPLHIWLSISVYSPRKEYFVTVFDNITERKKAEENIQRKLEVEKTISAISARLMVVSDIDNAINASLEDMGRLSGAGRAYLFLIREGGNLMDNTHEWCAEGVTPQIDNLQRISPDTVPWWMEKLRKGEIINIHDVSKMPPEAEAEKQILQNQDIKSLLVLPVYVGGELGGFIGFDNVTSTGRWSEDDLALLRVCSGIIGAALERNKSQENLRWYQNRLRSLAAELAMAGEQERKQIASGLHDAVAQTLAAAGLRLQTVEGQLQANQDLAGCVGKIRTMIGQALKEVRSLIFDLSPPVLHQLGLEAAIQWLIEKMQAERGLATNFEDDGQPKPLAEDTRAVLFRAIRELLINIAEHAGTKKANVCLATKGPNIQVQVEDDGRGFNWAEVGSPKNLTGGFGLFNIRERLDHCQGSLQVESKPGQGTRVTLVAPLKKQDKAC